MIPSRSRGQSILPVIFALSSCSPSVNALRLRLHRHSIATAWHCPPLSTSSLHHFPLSSLIPPVLARQSAPLRRLALLSSQPHSRPPPPPCFAPFCLAPILSFLFLFDISGIHTILIHVLISPNLCPRYSTPHLVSVARPTPFDGSAEYGVSPDRGLSLRYT